MKLNKNLLKGTVFGLVVAAGLVILARDTSFDPPLFDKAKRDPSVEGSFKFPVYQWHPEGYLLTERYVNHVGWRFFRVDLGSGKETLLRSYEPKGNGYAFEDRAVISADGKWCITTLEKQFYLVDLRGSAVQTVPNRTKRTNGSIAYMSTVAWLPDGARWVELANENGASVLLVRSVNSAVLQTIPLGVTDRYQSLLGVTPDNKAIVHLTTQRLNRLAIVPLEGKGQPITATVKPPPSVYLQRAALSPTGDRILWYGTRTNQPPLAAKLLSLFSRNRTGSWSKNGLWTSSVRGTNWDLIGVFRPELSTDDLQHIRMTPDGNRASFLYRNHFFTLDLNPQNSP